MIMRLRVFPKARDFDLVLPLRLSRFSTLRYTRERLSRSLCLSPFLMGTSPAFALFPLALYFPATNDESLPVLFTPSLPSHPLRYIPASLPSPCSAFSSLLRFKCLLCSLFRALLGVTLPLPTPRRPFRRELARYPFPSPSLIVTSRFLARGSDESEKERERRGEKVGRDATGLADDSITLRKGTREGMVVGDVVGASIVTVLNERPR